MAFDNLLNFRDVGDTINQHTGIESLRRCRFYRAARPDEASPQDRLRLLEDYGIRSIIDLRTEAEHIQQAKKSGANVHSSAAVPQTNDKAAQPLKIPGIKYYEINFNGSGYANSLMSKLSWLNYGKVIGLMLFGHRVEAIRILGENVLNERGIVGLAIDSIDACRKEVKKVFDVLSKSESYPVMVHCTQGKDRTGLVVLLTLLLLNIPEKAIAYDYMLSQEELEPERQSRLEEIRSIGLQDKFADCSPELVARVGQHITERYGSVESYLVEVGVTKEMQQGVREILATERR